VLEVGNAPVSWGVFEANAPTNPPWAVVLDGIASSGYRWLELGPVGFLPDDAEKLRRVLDERGLGVIGTFLYEELQDASGRQQILDIARRTCELLAAVDARYLVVIQAMTVDRMQTAGRDDAARRLDERGWEALIGTVAEVARLASEDYGLTPAFHPHAASYVEFADEIEHLLTAIDPRWLALCIDTGHSAYAGLDPVELLARNRERTAYLHFKDVDGATRERVRTEKLDFESALAAGIFCPLGRGVVDFERLRVELANDTTVAYATVEQDIDPRDPIDPSLAAAESLEYLRRVGLAEAA
jgi:inosose dehydratase